MRKPSLSDCYSHLDPTWAYGSPDMADGVAARPLKAPHPTPAHSLTEAVYSAGAGSYTPTKPLQRMVADPRYSSAAVTSALITALLLGALVAVGILQCFSSIAPQPSPDGYSALPVARTVL